MEASGAAFCSGTFGPVPDLVVSGINPGHNTGRSVLFSSTVGAILAARVAGVGGLAVSCGFAPRHRYDTATAVTTRIVDWMTATGAVGLSLNINVPDLDLTALGGIRITTLATKSMFTLRFSRDTEGMHLHRDHRRAGFPPGSDSAAVADGCVSLTALSGVEADNGALADADTRAQLETSILDAIRLAALP